MSIFERMADKEVEAMFEVEGNQARIRPWLNEGITWLTGRERLGTGPCAGTSGRVGSKPVSVPYESRGGGDVFAQYRVTRQAGRIPLCFRDRPGPAARGPRRRRFAEERLALGNGGRRTGSATTCPVGGFAKPPSSRIGARPQHLGGWLGK